MLRFGLATAAVALAAASVPALSSAAGSVSPADRAAINRTLAVFVPAAVGRVRSVRAWKLATPYMHLGATRADWAKGSLPVPPFAVTGTSFHGWTTDSAGRNRANIVLMVHLRPGGDVGAVSFTIAVRKLHGRWLVDSAVPAATFAGAGQRSKILAQPDFAPGGGAAYSSVKSSLHGRISSKWLAIIPAILVGLIVLVPVGVWFAHRMRDRRARTAASTSRV